MSCRASAPKGRLVTHAERCSQAVGIQEQTLIGRRCQVASIVPLSDQRIPSHVAVPQLPLLIGRVIEARLEAPILGRLSAALHALAARLPLAARRERIFPCTRKRKRW